MNDKVLHRKASEICIRVLALFVIFAMILTADFSAIALDRCRSLKELAEQTFTLRPEEDVTVTLSGLMPVNGYAEAESADVEGENVLCAYDIAIYYSDDSEFEPSPESPITVSFMSGEIADVITNGDVSLEVEHIRDNGETETIDLVSAENDEAVFEAESFSVYVIKTHDKNNENLNPRRTYHFLSPQFSQTEIDGVTHYRAPAYEFPDNLNEMVTTQTIRSGESLQEIVLPENDNSGLFYGWFVVRFTGITQEVTAEENRAEVTRTNYVYDWGTGTPEHISFGEPITFPQDETDDSDIYLAPLFGRYRFLTFHQDIEGSDNANTIISRKLIALGDDRKCTLKISDVRAPSTNPNRIIFWGWKFTHKAGDSLDGITEMIQTVDTDDSEIEKSITIEDTRIINGTQPSSEELRHMIYDVWPIFKEARWVYFDNGGSGTAYTPPQFIMVDEPPTSFGNVPERTGWNFTGWFYKKDGKNIRVTDSSAKIILPDSSIPLETGVSIERGTDPDTGQPVGKLVMTNESEEQTFYAEWEKTTAAKYHVIVWKQKITDDKNAADEEKAYDFEGYYELSGDTSEDATATSDFINGHFTSFTTDSSKAEDFIGFHYNAGLTTVTDNKYGTDGSKVNPNGSTVVNVYYDRDLMSITYHYQSTQLSGVINADSTYAYAPTTSNVAEQYGYINGQYVPLVGTPHYSDLVYSFSSKYTRSENTDEIMYGIAGDEYVPLTRTPVYYWRKSGYVYTPTSATGTSGFYGIVNGAFTEVYYYSRYGWIYSSGYSSYYYRGSTVYTRSSGDGSIYEGTRYTLSGSSLNPAASDSGTQYGMDDNGAVYTLTSTLDYYEYSYNGVEYTGDRYTRETDNTFYTGTLYAKTANGFIETEDTSGAVYGLRGDAYEPLTKSGNQLYYTWKTEDGADYTGTRYLRYTRENNSGYSYKEIWTGLYQQPFSMYGYVWPTTYSWAESTASNAKKQTLLTGFTVTDNDVATTDYHLYASANTGTKTIYHLRQKLDGTYSPDDDFASPALVSAGNSTFTFTDKFDGYTVAYYSSTFDASASGATKITSANRSGVINTTAFNYVYHERHDTLDFVFNDNYGENHTHTISDVKYEQSLSGFADVYTPATRANYTFTGWYEDSSCTKRFDFDSTMPAANKMIYAGWSKIRFRVIVDPNGGEFPLGGIYSTYFKVDYDEPVSEYGNTRRTYYEDAGGDYVYVKMDYNVLKDFPDVDLDGAYRKAFYIKKSDIEKTYNMVFSSGGKEYSYSYVMSFDQFRACIDMNKTYSSIEGTTESFRLVSWHKVRADGSVEQTPFNFKSQLTEDTVIQARWVQVGGFSLTYSPTMTSTGITGDIARANDPLESGRKYADKSPVIILQEPSSLYTTGAGGHEIDVTEWVFRGWRIVDGRTREPLEGDVFYDPGDTMILDAQFADSQGVIHMEAYYERRASTVRRVDVASLTLHANSPTASVNSQGLAGDSYENADIINKQLKLERRNNNFKVGLSDYINNFTNSDGSLLLGWNTSPDPGTYIPEYYADAVIGVNKTLPNDLYAVWEPMIYLTLQNTTSRPVAFNLKFRNYGGTVYEGYANTMNDEVLDRKPFSESSFVKKNSSGDFDVELPANTSVKLVIPEGVLDDMEGTYDITGTYATSNSKNLFIYNSGSPTSISIVKSNNNWTLNGSTTSASPIPYSTNGSLIKGPQGRLVRFVEENTKTKLNLHSRCYDVSEGKWIDATSSTGAKADAHFVLTNSGNAQESSTDSGYTTSVNLINNNLTATFGLTVKSYDSENYKFIGWYYNPEAAPNTYSVDRHANDFGERTVSGLAVPSTETDYYALFVPYIKGSLEIVHNERADSAGHCDADAGLGLKIEYYTKDDESDIYQIAAESGNRQSPASCTLDETIIDEKNTDGKLKVTVSARPDSGSSYKATYRDQIVVPKSSFEEDAQGYISAVFDAPVSARFADSDTVKGLKELRTVSYSSVFSCGYDITYRYTARDGSEKTLEKQGSADTFDNFDEYVIDRTPYERTLAGDTVWDIENITQTEDENGMHAVLNEIASFRSKCTVTIMEAGGYTPTERVEYGETFSEEQARKHLAPSEKDGLQFDYWDIMNTDTGEHIANCYSEKFTFAVWNNYTITPHYSEQPAGKADEGTFVIVDYIDTSRNQWGTEIDNDDGDADRRDVTDKVIADLDISFIDRDRMILDADDGNGNNPYQLGVMFEVVGRTEDGTFDKTAYADGEADREQRVATLIGASTSANGSAKIGGVNCYFSKIAITPDTVSNFNRSEFARSFNTSAVKDKVLRMYAYMKTPEGNIVLSAPKYITMYEYAKSDLGVEISDRSRNRSRS